MSKNVIFLFPGQGAQYVGMGKDLYDEFPKAKELFDKADELLGYKLTEIMFNGPEERLRETEHCQLAIYLHSTILLALIGNKEPTHCAGLSLGEYSAMVAAGIISFEEGLRLVQKRATLMQAAAQKKAGTLAAVMGLELAAIETIFSTLNDVWVANLNCPGQVVIGGTLEGIEKASEALKEAGAKRIIPLNVSGAFHTPLMKEAAEGLKPFIDAARFQTPQAILFMNAVGSEVSDISEMKKRLFEQVMSPVYFEKILRALTAEECEIFEIGPGKTLSGMIRKINRDLSVNTLDRALDLKMETEVS